MRHIGNISGEASAQAFGDFLLANGIRSEIEPDSDGSWVIWARDEDRFVEAEAWLQKFRTNPNAAEFRQASAEAAKIRAAEAKALAEYRQRIRSRRGLFPKIGGYGVGILTYVLIVLCAVVAFYSRLGHDKEFLRHLFISDPTVFDRGFLPEVFQHGEVWRLFTPIFIHFGIIHFLFNMMWLYQLGCMIEGRLGTGILALLTAVVALCSNVAQYTLHGPAFGGMSGVVYGLAGFVWMRGKFHRASGVGLSSQNVTILLVWLVICYTGLVGPVANTAHLAGLLTGIIWGRISAWLATRRAE